MVTIGEGLKADSEPIGSAVNSGACKQVNHVRIK
jgi:hypothetical protein